MPRRQALPRWLLPAAGLGLALLLALTLLSGIETRAMGACDDAFISFRVARNLARGHGLRFNPGGPPVEAASNFLLTVVLAGAHRAGLSILQSSLAINIAAGLATVLLLAWIVVRHVGPWGLWAPAALALMTLFCRNLVNGLETGLLGLLLLAAVACHLHAPRPRRGALLASALLLALVSLTRPEGPLYALTLGLLWLWDLLRGGRRPGGAGVGLRPALTWAAALLGLYLPYLIWRLVTFGTLLPNTYHAKEAFFSGWSHKLQQGALYLRVVSLMEPLFPVALVTGAALLVLVRHHRLRALTALLLAQALFMVLSGGDWTHMFGFARFLAPLLPLVLWLLAEAGGRLRRLGQQRLALTLALPLLVLSQLDLLRLSRPGLPPHFHLQLGEPTRLTRRSLVQALGTDLRRHCAGAWWRRATATLRQPFYAGTFDAAAGRWLRQRYGAGTRLAGIQAGMLAYYSDLPLFDLFGLATPGVAALRGDPAALLDRLRSFDPRLVTFYRWGDDVHHRELVAEGSLFSGPRGYGLAWALVRGRHRALLVFEQGLRSDVPARHAIFTPLPELPALLPPRRVVLIK
jgi:hypothetical protein